MANNKNNTTTETEVIENKYLTEDLDYSTIVNNLPYCYRYYNKELKEIAIDYTLQVLEDDENVYVITTDEIITLPKADMADETSINEKEAKKKQKQIDKFVKKMDKQIKELNKQIKKGTVKKKK